jgi:hypothetical protein
MVSQVLLRKRSSSVCLTVRKVKGELWIKKCWCFSGGRCGFETEWKSCTGEGIDPRNRILNCPIPSARGSACLCEWTHAAARGRGKVDGVVADFSGSNGAQAVIAKVPTVDVPVNNVGIFEPKPVCRDS